MNNTPTKSKFPKKYPLISFVILLAIFQFSCRVTFVASYDAGVSEQIENIAQTVDKFYLSMQETTQNDNNERVYSKYVEDYINIEVELNSLLNKNRVRPLNKESTRNCEIAVETWVKYREKHKEQNKISNVDIELNRDFMRDLFIVILAGEEAKKNAN